MPRTIRLKITRTDTWYPEYEVPDHVEDENIYEHLFNEHPASVFDEMCNKHTLETETTLDEILEEKA
jgi:hypothetical protein